MSDSLYSKMGGEKRLKPLVNCFFDNIIEDDRINHFISRANRAKLEPKVYFFFMCAFGGPAKTQGFDLAYANRNIRIRLEDFSSATECLAVALEQQNMSHLLDDVLEVLAPMIDGVVDYSHEFQAHTQQQPQPYSSLLH